MNVSRQDIYSYVSTLLKDVTSNIYRIEIPEILTTDAISNGFIVLKMNALKDNSEMGLNTYSQVRVYIESYVPALKDRGTINTSKYKAAQDAIDAVINAECEKQNQSYTINRDDGVLSMEDYFTNKTNFFFVYITSFLVTITNEV